MLPPPPGIYLTHRECSRDKTVARSLLGLKAAGQKGYFLNHIKLYVINIKKHTFLNQAGCMCLLVGLSPYKLMSEHLAKPRSDSGCRGHLHSPPSPTPSGGRGPLKRRSSVGTEPWFCVCGVCNGPQSQAGLGAFSLPRHARVALTWSGRGQAGEAGIVLRLTRDSPCVRVPASSLVSLPHLYSE